MNIFVITILCIYVYNIYIYIIYYLFLYIHIIIGSCLVYYIQAIILVPPQASTALDWRQSSKTRARNRLGSDESASGRLVVL